MPLRSFGSILPLVCLVLAACGEDDDPTDPSDFGEPGIELVAGSEQTDTIDAELDQALVVVVRDSAGELLPGVDVVFESLSGPSFVLLRPLESRDYSYPVVLETDVRGRAAVRVTMGYNVGLARVRVLVPEFGFADTAHYVVEAGAPVRANVAPRDTARLPGGSYALRSSGLRDRRGNVVAGNAEPVFSVISGPATVSQEGVVTAGASIGRARIVAAYGRFEDTVSLSVVPEGYLVGVEAFTATAPDLVRFRTDGEVIETLVTGASSWIELHPTAASAGDIVFQSDWPATYLTTPESPEAALVTDGPAAQVWARFTADEQSIVFAGGATPESTDEVWAVSAAGGPADLLWEAPGHTIGPSLSADGDLLAVVVETSSYQSSLRIVDVASGEEIGSIANANIGRYSPTADRLAVLIAGDLWVSAADGTGRALLADGGDIGFSPRNLGWSADGEWVVVFAPETPSAWDGQLVLVEAETGLQLPLGLHYSQAAWAE